MATLDQMREALKEIYDPEIPINIVDLGLVYRIEQTEPGKVLVQFTLTNPMCPIGEHLSAEICRVIGRLEGVAEVRTQMVWDPIWTREKMTPEGKLQASLLGFGGPGT